MLSVCCGRGDKSLYGASKHTQPGLMTTGLRSPNMSDVKEQTLDAASPLSWVFVTEQRYKRSGDSETGPFSADE